MQKPEVWKPGWCMQSKTANIYMATEIERQYGSQGLHGIALHPGGVVSQLGRHVPEVVKMLSQDPYVQNYLKNPEQGAATSVFAAVAKEWEGHGGRYLEDCADSKPYEGQHMVANGYVPHAYDEAAAKQLWDVSLKLVGLS